MAKPGFDVGSIHCSWSQIPSVLRANLKSDRVWRDNYSPY
jgi:hypothetical protein